MNPLSSRAIAFIAAGIAALTCAACSSSSSSPPDAGQGNEEASGSSSGTLEEGGGSSGGSSSSGGATGSCDAGVYSYNVVSGAGMMVQCTASYAPEAPSGFTPGHCPAGYAGCCVSTGPCGLTGNCTYIAAEANVLMGMCTGTWTTTAP